MCTPATPGSGNGVRGRRRQAIIPIALITFSLVSRTAPNV